MSFGDVPWIPSEDAKLMELWKDDSLAAREIGTELGRSKNAIIGRARRIGLPMRASGHKKKGDNSARASNRIGRRRGSNLPVVKHRRAYDWTGHPEPSMGQGAGIPLLDTKPGHCRAIIDKELKTCCGNHFPIGRVLSFCDYHMRRYTQPPRYRHD